MKLIQYCVAGRRRVGLLKPDGVVDLSARIGVSDLRTFMESGFAGARAAENAAPDHGVDEITYLPPIERPERILCIGLNYDAHRLETGRDKTDYPTVFTRFASTLVGHGSPLVRPSVSSKLDYEGELALIIGRPGRHIAAADAHSYIAGYSCFMDASVRDFQRHTTQFTPGKNFPATGGFGPALVTPDEVPDPTQIELVTRLNGEEMQRGNTSTLIFPVAELIAYLSRFTPLSPGDVIATGTPSGVGYSRKPPVYLAPGDRIEVAIESVGLLAHGIVDEI